MLDPQIDGEHSPQSAGGGARGSIRLDRLRNSPLHSTRIQPVGLTSHGKVPQPVEGWRGGKDRLKKFGEFRLVCLRTHPFGKASDHRVPQYPLPDRAALALLFWKPQTELGKPAIEKRKPKLDPGMGRLALIRFKYERFESAGDQVEQTPLRA